jgi:putative two-component system response regulator
MGSILIVDDEPSIRQLVARWLGDAGYSFKEAESADVAMNVMSTTPAAVVFCDVQMPGHDGLWLTRQLRTHYPTTAVILATGVTTVPPSISMQSGVLAYLVKPFRRETLMDALKQGLHWHAQASESGMSADDASALDDWLNGLETN